MPIARSPEWHVIATTHGHHFDAENAIADAGWKVFNPLHLQQSLRKPPKIVPLFPGYLFVPFHDEQNWGPLQRIRYVWSLVAFEPGRPATVPLSVIEDLQRRSSPRRVVDDPLLQPSAYPPGTQLTVRSGPLAGLEGICRLSAGARVRLLFELFGRPIEAEFAAADLIEAPAI